MADTENDTDSDRTEDPLEEAPQANWGPVGHRHRSADDPPAAGDSLSGEEIGADQRSEIDVSRLYRREGIISNVELRVDVADQIACMILEDEEVTLDSKTTHMRGDLMVGRGSRDREVTGRYRSHVGHQDLRMVGDTIVDRVDGGVELRARVESEVIMGGAYVNTIAGAYLRMCAWADFLAWGGWMEASMVRVEVAALMIRSNLYYANACGARVVGAVVLVDDYQNRIENFGILDERELTNMSIGCPGSGITVEA